MPLSKGITDRESSQRKFCNSIGVTADIEPVAPTNYQADSIAFAEKLASRRLILRNALSFTARQISVASKLQCFRIVTQTIERDVGKTSQGAFD
jgi:hypothetical protein